jgi:hypothetical protein
MYKYIDIFEMYTLGLGNTLVTFLFPIFLIELYLVSKSDLTIGKTNFLLRILNASILVKKLFNDFIPS